MDEQRLREIRARVEAATDGPWEMREGMVVADKTLTLGGFTYLSNALFAAASRQDVPDLLSALAASQQRERRLAEAMKSIVNVLGPSACKCEGLAVEVDIALEYARAALAAAEAGGGE
jgi:hypothetical protein